MQTLTQTYENRLESVKIQATAAGRGAREFRTHIHAATLAALSLLREDATAGNKAMAVVHAVVKKNGNSLERQFVHWATNIFPVRYHADNVPAWKVKPSKAWPDGEISPFWAWKAPKKAAVKKEEREKLAAWASKHTASDDLVLVAVAAAITDIIKTGHYVSAAEAETLRREAERGRASTADALDAANAKIAELEAQLAALAAPRKRRHAA